MAGILEGKAAIVTGAGRGIGRAIALQFAKEGAAVVVNDLGSAVDGSGKEAGPADEVVAEIRAASGKAVANYESVTDFAVGEKLIKTCVAEFGKIDIMMNVAGIERAAMIFNMTAEAWDQVLKVHLYGTFNCARHACVQMREQKFGTILNITSDAFRGTVGHANYGAAKGGIVTLTTSIAREMGRYGVTCNAIAPSAGTRMSITDDVRQGMQKRLAAGLITKEQMDAILNRPGPEYIAPFMAYLGSDEARHVNGQIFKVEPGRIGIYTQAYVSKSVHRDYETKGAWTVQELRRIVPPSLLDEYVNPAPPAK